MNEAPPNTGTSTKERILAAAERLFAEQGVAATSLRSVIAAAGVNLAAIHYHFGSKEELIKAVALRVTGPMNERRLAVLDDLEQEYGEAPVPLEALVDAFVAPIVHLADDPVHGETFMNLVGRMMAEPDYFFGRIAAENFYEVRRRFVAAFRRTLPEIPDDELFWCLVFSIGTVAHTLRVAPYMPLLSDGACGKTEVGPTVRRLVRFLTAGLKAPVKKEEES